MNEKHASLVILTVIAIIAIVGLVLFFKAGQTGEATGGRIVAPYQGGAIQKPIAAEVYDCQTQGRLGNVPKDFTMGLYSTDAMKARGASYCVKAPANIAPIEYCCLPNKPLAAQPLS